MVLVCKGLLEDNEERAIIRISPKNNTVDNSIVLKMRLHCEGCIRKIRKVISKFKGVELVSIDNSKDLVTVKGTVNVEELVSYLKQKLRRNVEVQVPAVKKDKDDGERKSKESARGGGERREKRDTTDCGSGVGGRKEEGGGGVGSRKEAGGGRGGCSGVLKVEGSKQFEFYDGYAYYQVENVQETTLTAIFSDENPNACVVM